VEPACPASPRGARSGSTIHIVGITLHCQLPLFAGDRRLLCGNPSSYKDYVDNERHLRRIVAVLSDAPATVLTLASSVGLAEDEVLRLLTKLRADGRVIKFADRDEWFLVLERAREGPRTMRS